MDPSDKDVTVDISDRKMYQLRFKFEDGTIISPSEIYDKVQTMIKDNTSEVRDTVGRVADLLLGQGMYQPFSIYFSVGWYIRKAVDGLEKKHGKCKIEYDEETLTKDIFTKHVGTFLKKQADKLSQFSEEVLKGNLPSDLFDES